MEKFCNSHKNGEAEALAENIGSIPITEIKGISTVRQKSFASMGIFTVADLLGYYPRTYQNRGAVKEVFETADGECVSLVLEIAAPMHSARIKSKHGGRMMTVQHITACDLTGSVKITFFNREFLKNTFTVGRKFRFYGVLSRKNASAEMMSPEFEPYSSDAELPPFVPVYPLIAGVTQKLVSSSVGYALERYGNSITETLDGDIIKKNGLCPRRTALAGIHFPKDAESLEKARRRLAFEELYDFFLKTTLLGRKETAGKAFRIRYPDMKAFLSVLPFSLTSAQKHAIHDVLKDISGTDTPELSADGVTEYIAPSRRLIQGDVGCGKTIAAAAVIYAAARSGFQSALMVPTGILAKQHYEELSALLENFGIRCVLLTGGMKASEKRTALELIESGKADVAVGTHAVIQDNVAFSKLALVITDEQHRFGVAQRKALEDKGTLGIKPHVVVMSATPIPRTLAMIMYCDLDISIIDQMPSGRKPVDTFSVGEDKRERVYKFIADLIKQGRQAYIVCPLAEPDDETDEIPSPELKNAKDYRSSLKKTVLSEFSAEYIHGKMKPGEKEEIMARFADGKTDILVSTTVIEVGVNVPNAAVMLIENAERFGLSQIHQLRGRVGRGSAKAYCILMSPMCGKSGADSDYSKRMKTVCESPSGFVIAEKDLELRGPGEFFGKRQSGEFRFSIADTSSDMELVKAAKEAAALAIERNGKTYKSEMSDML